VGKGRRLECQVSAVGGSCPAQANRAGHFEVGEIEGPRCCRCPRRPERSGEREGVEWSAVGWAPVCSCTSCSASASPQVQVAERERQRAGQARQARPLAHPDFVALRADLLVRWRQNLEANQNSQAGCHAQAKLNFCPVMRRPVPLMTGQKLSLA